MVVEVADFEHEVIEKSYETPVVVDFWAPWCGPCRMLGPVLEKLAEENRDRWTLAKLNTDENPTIAARYGIRSIPAVKLFVDGRVVDEFLGALPEPAVRQWLNKAIPSPEKKLLDAARAQLAAGEASLARQTVKVLLGEFPDNPDGKLLLARIDFLDDARAATKMVRETRGVSPDLYPLRDAMLTIEELLQKRDDPSDLPESPAKQRYLEAVDALLSGDAEGALSSLVQVVRLDRHYDDDGARKACIALFTILGEQDERTRRFRRELELALF